MRGRNSLSSFLDVPLDTACAEPPLKRPRTVGLELSPAITGSSPVPGRKSSGAAAPSASASCMLMSHLGEMLDTHGVPSDSEAGWSSLRPLEGSSATSNLSSVRVGGGGGAPWPTTTTEGEVALSSSGTLTPALASATTGSDERDSLVRERGQDHTEEYTVRDEEFYIDSADCVIRVDNTLFKVHRFFLGRDSSAFQQMFSIPAQHHIPSSNLEGCSDESPIRLYGESVERFRTLLSVIYELPLQLQIYNTPAANVDRLLLIAEMANKYHFATIETWAVDALYNVISGLHGPPQAQYELSHCSSAWMKRLLEIALLCGHVALRNYVVQRWVDRIVARDLRPIHALEIAERSGIRRLQGYAYYVQLLEMGNTFDPGVVEDGKQYSRSRLGTAAAAALASPNGNGNGNGNGENGTPAAQVGTPATLTPEQRQQLLSGHWSLSWLWDTLRMTPPKFHQQEGCTYHQQRCATTWNSTWREVGKSERTQKHAPGDVLGRLRAMEEQLLMHPELSRVLIPQCKRAALSALKATIREVQEGLADHFANLTSAQATAEQEESS